MIHCIYRNNQCGRLGKVLSVAEYCHNKDSITSTERKVIQSTFAEIGMGTLVQEKGHIDCCVHIE